MSNVAKSWRVLSGHFPDIGKWWVELPAIFHAALGAILTMASISPLFMPVIRRDSGVFLYMGWRLLSGEIPYRDVWDHKPPIIYLIDALGLLVGNGSRWGVWLLELAFLVVAIFIGIKLFKHSFGKWPALLATYLWLLGMTGIISGGNYTTEYALPLQFACYWLLYEAEKLKKYALRFYLIGILCGIVFFLKQNTIGIGIAITVYLLFTRLSFRQYKRLAADLLAIASGALTVIAVLVVVLIKLEALPTFWDAVFLYNFSYIHASILERIVAVIKGLGFLSGLTFFAATGWFLSLLLLTHKVSFLPILRKDASNLLILGLIDLPIELLFLAISGNSYRHYYLTLLPVFALFSAFVFQASLTQTLDHGAFPKIKKKLEAGMIAFSAFSLIATSIALSADLNFRSRRAVDNNEVANYIEHHSEPDDYVLMWGAETTFNFVTKRRSPSRFSYQYPLYLEGYTSPAIVEEFLVEVIENKPSLIIDTNNSLTPMYEFTVTSPKINELIIVLKENYTFAESLGSWTIYKNIEKTENIENTD